MHRQASLSFLHNTLINTHSVTQGAIARIVVRVVRTWHTMVITIAIDRDWEGTEVWRRSPAPSHWVSPVVTKHWIFHYATVKSVPDLYTLPLHICVCLLYDFHVVLRQRSSCRAGEIMSVDHTNPSVLSHIETLYIYICYTSLSNYYNRLFLFYFYFFITILSSPLVYSHCRGPFIVSSPRLTRVKLNTPCL